MKFGQCVEGKEEEERKMGSVIHTTVSAMRSWRGTLIMFGVARTRPGELPLVPLLPPLLAAAWAFDVIPINPPPSLPPSWFELVNEGFPLLALGNWEAGVG